MKKNQILCAVFSLLLAVSVHAETLSSARSFYASKNISSVTPRIVGGQVSHQDAWPSYVVLANHTDPDNAFCGATLIAPSWVLSAAHCFSGKRFQDVTVTIGLYEYLGQTKRNAKEYFGIKQVIHHPQFIEGQISAFDLVLVELDGVSKLPVATLYAGDATLAGNMTTVVGFGDTVQQPFDFSIPSNYLADRYQVSLPIVDNTLCAQAMSSVAPIDKSQICVGVPEGKKDSCVGDSGGPLYLNRKPNVVVGVVSYGVGCALPGYYSVNTRVSAHIDFIRQYVPNVIIDSQHYGYTLSREVSGAWYDPERNGEGWIIEMLPNNRISVYWFTYDLAGGKSIFLTGTNTYDPNSDRVDIRLYKTSGAVFGDAFDKNDVELADWGTLTFIAKSCSHADIEYRSKLAEYGSGKYSLTRLTSVNTSNCAGRFDNSERRLAGSWFDPLRNGEGLIVETLQKNLLGFYFFTYDFSGHQQTILGVAHKQTNGAFVGTAYTPFGPRFGSNYDKNDLVTSELGQVSIMLQDCNHIIFRYVFSGAYGQHMHYYQRLTNIEGNGCVSFD